MKLETMVALSKEEKGQGKGGFKMLTKGLSVLAIGLFLAAVSLGCRTLPGKAAEEALSYQFSQDVEITKLSFYLKVPRDLPYPVCWVDVSLRNLSASEQSFLVLVQVDDEPGVALRTKKPLGPKKEETLSLITMSKDLPKRFSVTVTH